MDMTPSQKAKITRQKHREAQRAKEAESREVKAKLKASLLTVVDNEEATPAEKLEASRLILDIDERVKTIYDKR